MPIFQRHSNNVIIFSFNYPRVSCCASCVECISSFLKHLKCSFLNIEKGPCLHSNALNKHYLTFFKGKKKHYIKVRNWFAHQKVKQVFDHQAKHELLLGGEILFGEHSRKAHSSLQKLCCCFATHSFSSLHRFSVGLGLETS